MRMVTRFELNEKKYKKKGRVGKKGWTNSKIVARHK
jgi:hypothetical protein